MTASKERQGAAYNVITHFILAPLFTLSFAWAIFLTGHHRKDNPLVYPWLLLLSFGLILLNLQSRLYALRLQDRVIHLEERLRLAGFIETAPWMQSLSKQQLIGLRFASDAEVPTLARQAAQEELTAQEIKSRITDWRRDDFRV